LIRRIKRRYIAFRIIDGYPTKNNLIRCIEFGLKGIKLQIIEYDENTGQGIIRCGHKSVRDIIDFLNSVSITVIGVSGTIKTLRRKFLNIYN
jgi:RNase P/RNase MRP subunit POP5